MHTNSGQFAVITAGSVEANSFTLIDPNGNTVGAFEYDSTAATAKPRITFRVNNALYTNGNLRWSANETGDAQTVQLRGPGTSTASIAALLSLDVSRAGGYSQAQLYATRTRVEALSTVTVAAPTITLTGNVSLGNEIYGGSVQVRPQDFVNEGGQIDLLGAGSYGSASLDNYQGDLRLFAATGKSLGLFGVTRYQDKQYQSSGKLIYSLVGQQRYTLAASASFGFQSFLMAGLTFTDVRPNDLFIVTCSLRILSNVAGGAFIGLLAVYGPEGLVSDPARIIAENPPLFSANTYSATWNHTATQGAGTYTFTIQGGNTGGTWTLINPDTWFTVSHFTQY